MSSIGQRIKELRNTRGLSQKSLGELAGVSQTIISKLETGGNEKSKELVKIAQVLAVSPTWLETGTGSMEDVPASSYQAKPALKEVLIKDNSMAPEIKPGHRIAYVEGKEPQPSDYVVIAAPDNTVFIRRLKCQLDEHGNESKLLVPNNDDYPVQSLKEPLKILGIAVEHIAPLSGASL